MKSPPPSKSRSYGSVSTATRIPPRRRTDRTSLVKIGGQGTHLFGSSVEGNIDGGYVHSLATHSGIVATVTGDGVVTPTMGDHGWFEYGARLGFRITQGRVADLFLNGTLGPQPVGNTIHGGLGLRINY